MAKRKQTRVKISGESENPNGVLEAQLGWNFKRPELLRLALTHRSFAYESRGGAAADEGLAQGKNPPGEDNEQLEFIGDAVLGLVVTEALYAEFPECTEGELTRMRSSLVSRERMGELGAAWRLQNLVLLGKSAEHIGSRNKPALLANAAEAVLAAVYLDAGARGLATVRTILQRDLLTSDVPKLRDALAASTGHGALRDSKTLLQERVQAESAGKLQYADAGESGPAHQRRFVVEARLNREDGQRVLATGEGSSKKEAQQRAAALALASWQNPVNSDSHKAPDSSSDEVV